MKSYSRHRGLAPRLLLLAVPVLLGSQSLARAADANQQLADVVMQADKLMAEEFRTSIRRVVVRPGTAPASGAVTGSYEKETLGVLDGANRGRAFGTISTEIGGIRVGQSIPILQLPGMIIGGLFGGSTREIQDYRDALTENLVEAAKTNLSNDALATDVFWRLHDAPKVEAKVLTPDKSLPPETEAVLYINFSDFTIDVQQDIAVLTMAATGSLRRVSDGQRLYDNQVFYQDRDSLADWIANEGAALTSFVNYARHYLGREIAAELIERVEVEAEMGPVKTASVKLDKKNSWSGVSKTSAPTLAWSHSLAPDDKQSGWAANISGAAVTYDLEIYDNRALVYAARQLDNNEFALDIELEPCRRYRWSVRPSYSIDGELRYGDWMRSNPDPANGNLGPAAAEAPAYIYDFASLEIKCGRR